MKKITAIVMVLIICLTFCACGSQKLTPEERVEEESVKFITAYVENALDDMLAEKPDIDINSCLSIKDNQWAILGTVYILTNKNSALSAKFGAVATYDEENDEFTYSKIEFDDFN